MLAIHYRPAFACLYISALAKLYIRLCSVVYSATYAESIIMSAEAQLTPGRFVSNGVSGSSNIRCLSELCLFVVWVYVCKDMGV